MAQDSTSPVTIQFLFKFSLTFRILYLESNLIPVYFHERARVKKANETLNYQENNFDLADTMRVLGSPGSKDHM